ncbi:MAG: peptidylprolyl isomerase [Lachnospiraceae bacterium]|nr:peptidylprolyl isomerase [Lachnospiraceae bacterium]
MRGLKRTIFAICCLFLMLPMGGCQSSDTDTKLVLYTGFKKDEVFRIETMSCMLPEIMVYLTNTQDQYESVFGREIWKTDLNGVTLEENIKETVLAQLAQIKTMNLLAQKYGVTLDENELKMVQEAAEEYYESLNETERDILQADEETINQLYAEFALANKVYEYIIKDINPEISDDEARNITVQYVLIKTYIRDGTGKKIEYTENAKQDVLRQSEQILEMARQDDSDFEELVLQYSEGEKGSISFGKGEMEPAFEEAAFNLATGEISEIVETGQGYNIIKCINTFNREETDANKVKIVEQRREEVFGQEYDAFITSLTRTLNEPLWEEIAFVENEEVTTSNFFDIYNQYFS